MDFVPNMNRLEHFDLRGNRIRSLMLNVENLLGRLFQLSHLDLSGKQISLLTGEMFAHLCGNLEHLEISNNPNDFHQ